MLQDAFIDLPELIQVQNPCTEDEIEKKSLYMWQSWVEIEHYSVASFNRITVQGDVKERSNEDEEAKKRSKENIHRKSKRKRSISMVERSDEISKESKNSPQCPTKFMKKKRQSFKKIFKGNCSRQNTYP